MKANDFNLLDKFIRHLRISKILPYLKKEDIVCDLGCGDGSSLRFLSSRIKEGYGLDKNIRESKENNLYFLSQDITSPLPFEDNKFDIILSLAVLEHLDSFGSLIKEAKRVLKNNGLFILTTPTPASKTLLEFLAFKLKIISEKEIRDHKHYYTKEELINLFKDNFQILKIKTFSFKFNTLIVLKKS